MVARMANLLRELSDAWAREGDSPPARAALSGWAIARPEVARFPSPAHLVRAAHSRADVAAQHLIDDLTEHAAVDPWAARTVLQAVLPGLARLTRDHIDMVGTGHEPFADIGELDQFLLCTAFERITVIAAEVPAFRLRSLLDSTWSRLAPTPPPIVATGTTVCP